MSEQSCLTPTCLTDRQVKEAVLSTKMNGILELPAVAAGLLRYSVFWQAPVMRAEMAKEINRLDIRDTKLQTDLDYLGARVTMLEGK